MPTNENAARAERAEIVDRFLRHAAEPNGEYRFRLTPVEYQALAAALRSADADRPAGAHWKPAEFAGGEWYERDIVLEHPARAAKAEALTALLDKLSNYGVTRTEAAACRAELAALQSEAAFPAFQSRLAEYHAEHIRDRTAALTAEPSEPEGRESPRSLTAEPLYPGLETVAWSFRYPDTTAHPKHADCEREEPHSTAECGLWTVPRSSDVAAGGERVEVAAFAGLMEDRLRRHDDKRGADGWKGETLDFLFDRLQAEVDELQVARLPGAIAEEAADVASFAMMIADVAGGLSDRTVRVLQQRRAANEPTDVAGGWPPGTLSTVAECRAELAALTEPSEPSDLDHGIVPVASFAQPRKPCERCHGTGVATGINPFRGITPCPRCGKSGPVRSDSHGVSHADPKTVMRAALATAKAGEEPGEAACGLCGATTHVPASDGAPGWIDASHYICKDCADTAAGLDYITRVEDDADDAMDTVPRSSDVAAGGERAEVAAFGERDLISCWPVRDVLLKLAEAAEHLLRDHDCDRLGHEGVQMAAKAARIHATAPGTNAVGTGEPWKSLDEAELSCPQCKSGYITDVEEDEPRQAANVTRLSVVAEPARDLLADAQVTVGRLIAERDTLADQRERLAEYVERLEAKVRALEGAE